MLSPLAEHSIAPAFSSWFDALADPMPGSASGWPLLATPVPASFPSPANDQIERHLSLDEHLIRHPEATFFMRVQGDELQEQGIHDGDVLVVDRAAAPSTGSWVVMVMNGQLSLARVSRDAQGRRVIQSADPAVADQPLVGEPNLCLWGVVRWAVHRLWPGRLAS